MLNCCIFLKLCILDSVGRTMCVTCASNKKYLEIIIIGLVFRVKNVEVEVVTVGIMSNSTILSLCQLQSFQKTLLLADYEGNLGIKSLTEQHQPCVAFIQMQVLHYTFLMKLCMFPSDSTNTWLSCHVDVQKFTVIFICLIIPSMLL